jgi:hypothetical protein
MVRVKLSLQEIKDKIMQFKEFVDVVRPREDPKIRPNLILNPENPLTTSNLSELEIEFITDSYFIAEQFPEFQPLKDYATLYLRACASKNGWAVDKVIEFEQAIGEKRMIGLGFKNEAQKPEKIKTNETKQ